jgi:hypothetical protein
MQGKIPGEKIPGKWSRGEIIQLVQRQRELLNAPGAQFSYSNTGYILLAEVVGRVTGVSFPEWMEENVFDLLEMEHTTIKTQSGQVIPNSAKGYAFPPPHQAWIERDDIDAFYGASSIYTTVQDLTRWLRNLRDAHVGGPQVISRMTERGVLTNGDTIDYGLGLNIATYRGLRRYGHTGEDGNRFALLHYYPEIDAGVVFICSNRFYRWTLETIAGEFFGEHMAPEEAPESESRESQEEEPTEIDPALLDAYAGRYYSQELEMLYTLRVEDGRLLLSHHRLEDYELQPREPDFFGVGWPFGVIRFERDNDGEITGFVARNVLFEKLR